MTEKIEVQLAVVGTGPAGLAAAIEAKKNGVRDIVVLDREDEAGGILKQCIHTGFGLQLFSEELTGPEYAERFIDECAALQIPLLLCTTVLSISASNVLTAVSSEKGVFEIHAKSVILATGCRERPRGSLMTAGTRPAGIFTAGTAQKYVNIEGLMPGKEVVILGSGDIGLIMARRMTLEGAKVKAVLELKHYSAGLTRNIVQCLDDFGIPLLLSHTVTQIHGKERLTGVTIAEVDGNSKPVAGTERFIACDTLLLSVGLIPENELAASAGIKLNPGLNAPIVNEWLQTSNPGIFACGNALHVHDLADNVTIEARKAGYNAAKFIQGAIPPSGLRIPARTAHGIRYVVPYEVNSPDEDITFFFRTDDLYRNVSLKVSTGNRTLLHQNKSKMTPGEMEHILLKKELLSQIDGDLVFALEEAK